MNLLNNFNSNSIFIIIMKQSKTNSFELTEEYLGGVRAKFSQLSALELKKQKITMVKDLEQINKLLDQVISQQYGGQARTLEEVTRQIEKNRKAQKALQKSLDNFQFMLTGDYSVRADEEINRLTTQVKTMREEVTRFGRMLSIPMQKDLQICDDLQKEVYRIEKDVEEIKIKNHKKRELIAQITEQNEKKVEGVKKIMKQIQKFNDDNESDQIIQNLPSSEELREYEELVAKKDRILNIIEKDQKRFTKVYKSKLKKYQEIEQASMQIQYFLKDIQKNLTSKGEQLHNAVASSRKKHRNSEPNVMVAKRKMRTQQNSETQNLIRYRQRNEHIGQQGTGYPSQSLPKVNRFSSQQNSDHHLLPRLYRALGKSRLQIQQDCNIRDLIYM